MIGKPNLETFPKILWGTFDKNFGVSVGRLFSPFLQIDIKFAKYTH